MPLTPRRNREAAEALCDALAAPIHQTPDGDDCPWYAQLKTAIANAVGEKPE
jgi:hypothetical protein